MFWAFWCRRLYTGIYYNLTIIDLYSYCLVDVLLVRVLVKAGARAVRYMGSVYRVGLGRLVERAFGVGVCI
jgi:hypothetical protein